MNHILDLKNISYNLNKLYDNYSGLEDENAIVNDINKYMNKVKDNINLPRDNNLKKEILDSYENILANNIKFIEKCREMENFEDSYYIGVNQEINKILDNDRPDFEQIIENFNEFIKNEQFNLNKDEMIDCVSEYYIKSNEKLNDNSYDSFNISINIINRAEFHLNRYIKKILILILLTLNLSSLFIILTLYIKFLYK